MDPSLRLRGGAAADGNGYASTVSSIVLHTPKAIEFSPFEKMPTEIIQEIIKWLGPRYRVVVRGINKLFQQVSDRLSASERSRIPPLFSSAEYGSPEWKLYNDQQLFNNQKPRLSTEVVVQSKSLLELYFDHIPALSKLTSDDEKLSIFINMKIDELYKFGISEDAVLKYGYPELVANLILNNNDTDERAEYIVRTGRIDILEQLENIKKSFVYRLLAHATSYNQIHIVRYLFMSYPKSSFNYFNTHNMNLCFYLTNVSMVSFIIEYFYVCYPDTVSYIFKPNKDDLYPIGSSNLEVIKWLLSYARFKEFNQYKLLGCIHAILSQQRTKTFEEKTTTLLYVLTLDQKEYMNDTYPELYITAFIEAYTSYGDDSISYLDFIVDTWKKHHPRDTFPWLYESMLTNEPIEFRHPLTTHIFQDENALVINWMYSKGYPRASKDAIEWNKKQATV